jgi:DNA-binding transcriptional LysR family regulator
LGVALLEPQGRRVRLTPAARVLLQHADAIQELWQRAEAEVHCAGTGEPSGTLRVAGFPTAASALLAPLAVRLHGTWPALTVQVREAEPLECFSLLFADDTDLAVVEATPDNPPSSDRRFDQRRLLDDPFDLLTSPGHALAGRPAVPLEDLATEKWVLAMPGSSCTARQLVMSACRSAGFVPSIAHEAREWSVAATFVSHGLGIALVPRLAVLPPELDVVRTPLESAPSRRLVSVTRRGSDGHPAVAAGLGLLRELAAGLCQSADRSASRCAPPDSLTMSSSDCGSRTVVKSTSSPAPTVKP